MARHFIEDNNKTFTMLLFHGRRCHFALSGVLTDEPVRSCCCKRGKTELPTHQSRSKDGEGMRHEDYKERLRTTTYI